MTGPGFVPPYPFRPETSYSIAKTIEIHRENMIAVFRAGDFSDRLLHRRLLRLHTFICNDPELVRSAFVAQHAIFERKSPQMRFALRPLLGDGLFVSDGAMWQTRRAIVGPIIHASRIADFAPIMVETLAEWRQQWLTRGDDASIDVLSEMAQLTAEIISRCVFGRRLGREFTGAIVEGFSDYQRRIDQLDLPSLLGLPSWFPRFRTAAVRKSLRRIHGVIEEVIGRFQGQQLLGEDDDKAVIGQLFAALDEHGVPLTREAIRNEATVIFMAGHETTANTLAWAWYLLSQAPWVQSKLLAELDAVLGGRAPHLADVSKLIYTRAIVEETLRLYPPVPLLARQAVRDGELDGVRVPKGSLVIVAPWLLHRSPELWSQPDHFMPERFDPRVRVKAQQVRLRPLLGRPSHLSRTNLRIDRSNPLLGDLSARFHADTGAGASGRSDVPPYIAPWAIIAHAAQSDSESVQCNRARRCASQPTSISRRSRRSSGQGRSRRSSRPRKDAQNSFSTTSRTRPSALRNTLFIG